MNQQDDNLTHKGWLYCVPVWCSSDAEHIVMRWTGWFWPVELACGFHNLLNLVFRNDMGFPVVITGGRE